MTLSEIMLDIGKRLGDPDLKKYRGLVRSVFVQSICDSVKAEEYDLSDINDIVAEVSANIYESDSEIVASLPADMLKLLDVSLPIDMHPDNTDTVLKEVDIEEVKRMAIEDAFHPVGQEVFYYRKGNSLRILLSREADLPNDFSIKILYIKSPDSSSWGWDTNLDYSLGFIYKCINNTVGILGGGGEGNNAER